MQRVSKLPLPSINNAWYDDLGDRWYRDDTHVIALLRAETNVKLQYLRQVFARHSLQPSSEVIPSLLDVGCGAGLISNELAKDGFKIRGIDQSPGSLSVARRHAAPHSLVVYEEADAFNLPDQDAQHEVVLLLDVLEHVEDPGAMIAEAARVLKPGGLLFFHTFNRTWLSRWLAIEAVKLLAKESPEHFHVWQLFIKPTELQKMASDQNLTVKDIKGIKPRIMHWPFWSSVLQRKVHPHFTFEMTANLQLGYIGYAVKKGS